MLTPNQFIGMTDAQSIQNAVDYAHEKGINSVTIPRINERTGAPVWNIDRAIILPSEMEIVLDNCHLRQADGCMDNIFRTFGDIEAEGHTLAEQKHNIVIRGQGHAVLDGANPNGLTQKTSLQDGLPHVSRNNLILFYNIRGFVIENLELRNQRWWAINLLHAERGRISSIHFAAECDRRNQDGIDLRLGCSNILIEKITGQVGDDVVALSAIDHPESLQGMGWMYRVEGHEIDIHDIIIKDIIATSVECSVIGIRNTDGKKIYNVTIDNIHCTDNYAAEDGKLYPAYPKFRLPPFDINRIRRSNAPYTLIRIGQPGYFKDRPNMLGEVYNIHATNLHMHMGCVVLCNISLENSYFGNIYAENDVDYIFTTKEARAERQYGADLRNVVIENVFYQNRDNDFATAFDFDINQKDFKAENVVIQNAFLGNCKNIFNMKMDGTLHYSGFYGANVKKANGTIAK
ncbi:MAG: hypothetical protein IKM48_06085 [Clostridia bacterium]|nr:hypothetical protein [Clostridia bacterium]